MLLYSSARQFNLISEHVHPPLQPGVHLKSAGLEKWELQTKGRMTETQPAFIGTRTADVMKKEAPKRTGPLIYAIK